MTRPPDKELTTGRKRKAAPGKKPGPPPRQDLPDPDSIVDEKYMTSTKGNTYRIIVTDEGDSYDNPARPPITRRRSKD